MDFLMQAMEASCPTCKVPFGGISSCLVNTPAVLLEKVDPTCPCVLVHVLKYDIVQFLETIVPYLPIQTFM